ncbi:hypothetical protein ACLOJK_025152 [Asimina triloba]
MVEEMYMEETKDQENNNNSSSNNNTTAATSNILSDGSISQLQENTHKIPNPSSVDQKPSPDHLLRDSESLSSIINGSSDKRDQSKQKDKHDAAADHLQFGRPENFGVVDLDFSPYNSQAAGASTVTYTNSDGSAPNFGSRSGGGGGSAGVSLTLGLQQHTGGGMSLSFSPAATQHSIFFSRQQHMDDCQPITYSILDGESQNLPEGGGCSFDGNGVEWSGVERSSGGWPGFSEEETRR